jgi:hypothetical protein
MKYEILKNIAFVLSFVGFGFALVDTCGILGWKKINYLFIQMIIWNVVALLLWSYIGLTQT